MTGQQPARLTADEIERLKANRCAHCGGTHARACPRVRRMAYHPNGNLASVEFWPDGKWSTDHVVFIEELPDPDEAGEEGGAS